MTPSPGFKRACRVAVGAALATCAAVAAAADYSLGQGYVVGDYTVSGYANLVAENPVGGTAALSVDDLSLFVSGQVNRWVNPFVEAEVTGATLARAGGVSPHRGTFVAERLYDDILLGDTDILRIGKILAPVGDWNLVHAAPLVPTSTRPLTTNFGFSEYANGVSWLEQASPLPGHPDLQVYAQPGGEWLPRPSDVTQHHYRNVWGGHLNWRLGGLTDKFGLSLQSGRLSDSGERYTLLGANVRRTFGRLRLESEMTWSHWHGERPGEQASESDRERGVYVLGDYAVDPHWHLVAEAEHFDARFAPQPSRNVLLGVEYKPNPGLVWRLEYVHQTGWQQMIPTGWIGALAVLF